MSHSVSVTLIADQEIRILGKRVNVHDICAIALDADGKIVDAWVGINKTVARSIVSSQTIQDSRGIKDITPKDHVCPYIEYFCHLSEKPCRELPESCKQFHDEETRKKGDTKCKSK